MNSDIGIGSVVLSTQGRDKGSYFVVTALGKNVVFLADGGMRKLNKPKKKNIKHVSDSGVILDGIAEKMRLGKKVFDSEIKSALRQMSERENRL